jgi:FixJ family two-component response regulator
MDFLTKPVDGTELLACVNQALDKCLQLHEQAQEIKSMQSRLEKLTIREKEIMKLMVEGHTSKEIADRLGISFRTVENHRAQVMHKTGSSNLLGLARIEAHLQGTP